MSFSPFADAASDIRTSLLLKHYRVGDRKINNILSFLSMQWCNNAVVQEYSGTIIQWCSPAACLVLPVHPHSHSTRNMFCLEMSDAMSVCPPSLATSSGVFPSSSRILTWATPQSRRRVTTSLCPPRHARCSGVRFLYTAT